MYFMYLEFSLEHWESFTILSMYQQHLFCEMWPWQYNCAKQLSEWIQSPKHCSSYKNPFFHVLYSYFSVSIRKCGQEKYKNRGQDFCNSITQSVFSTRFWIASKQANVTVGKQFSNKIRIFQFNLLTFFIEISWIQFSDVC